MGEIVKSVGRNKMLGRGLKFYGENRDFKKWGGERISSCMELYTPLIIFLYMLHGSESRRLVLSGPGVDVP